MGRRRRQDDDYGLVSLALDTAKQSPVVGMILAAVFCAAGAYLYWGNRTLLMGLAPLVGGVLGILGVMCAVISAIEMIRGRLAPRRAKQRLDRHWNLDAVRAMSWQDFERLIADVFRRLGYVQTPFLSQF